MTIHSCRDLLIGSNYYATGALDTMHAMSAFMQGVVGFTHHSSAGILGPGALPSTTINYYHGTFSGFFTGSDFTLLSSSIMTVKALNGATIGMGPGRENWVRLSTDMVNMMSAAYPQDWPHPDQAWPTPDGSPAVSPFTNKWLILKSNEHPLANSGIFLIVSESISDNAIIIDYRSPTTPPPETGVACTLWHGTAGMRGDSGTGIWPTMMSWTGNGLGTRYNTRGAASYPRQLLTSPSPLGWQLRLCIESTNDMGYESTWFLVSNNLNSNPQLTAIPGFSGSGGDFPIGKHTLESGSYAQHLHPLIWNDSNKTHYRGTLPAFDQLHWPNIGVGGFSLLRYRFFAWGDDETGTCFFALRNDVSHPSDHYVAFGQPEDETVPLPDRPICRLFALGEQRQFGGIDWRAGSYIDDPFSGVAFSLGKFGEPISCVPSSYAYVQQYTNAGSIRYDPTAGTSSFTHAHDILPVDLIAGTIDSMYYPAGSAPPYSPIFKMEPRRMGRMPIARQGPAYGVMSGTTIGLAVSSSVGYNSWYHFGNGVYLPWGTVAPLNTYGASAVSSSLALERTTLCLNTFFTGTILPSAQHRPEGANGLGFDGGATDVIPPTDSMNTGSWPGLANTWGVTTLLVDVLASSSSGRDTGKWHFVGYSYGLTTLVTESYDRYAVIEDGRPAVNNSVGAGEWNPFPVPPMPAEAKLPPRDLTRYTKTYSSQRQQVKRIRLVRR